MKRYLKCRAKILRTEPKATLRSNRASGKLERKVKGEMYRRMQINKTSYSIVETLEKQPRQNGCQKCRFKQIKSNGFVF